MASAMMKSFRDENAKDMSDSGCRPCCSMPHGYNSVLAATLATLAWLLSFVSVTNCHFLTPDYLYCHPPPTPDPKFGSCGDCHCINLDKPCPNGPGEVPLTQVPDDWLKQLKAMETTNPYEMKCNPYNTTEYLNCTDPPLVERQIELWETAVCGHLYDMSALDENQCPTQYEMVTYDSKEAMEAAGAVMTHWGACGACSTSKDLAVYLEYPDLTGKGQECAIRGLPNFGGSFAQGIECFQEVGYTYSCAEMWMYNVENTRDTCFDVCVDFTFLGDGSNNGPPPECKIANCLLCDEQMSGPFFQTVAARSRRRSGLLSKIVRACEVLLIVDHEPPCNVTRRSLGRELQSSQRITAPPQFTEPEPTETCVFIDTDLGLTSYESTDTNNWLVPKLFLSAEEAERISSYDSCFAYEFNGVISGFWRNQRDIFGSAYNAANAFGSLALIIGIIGLVCVWCSTCIASGNRFWTTMTLIFGTCGAFMILTLVFFASKVCENGCKMGSAAITAIVSAFVWWGAAGFSFGSKPVNEEVPRANCCCCPTIKSASNYSSIPATAEEDEVVEVEITETTNASGDVVIEKTTSFPGGNKVVERTTHKKNAVEQTLKASTIGTGDMQQE
ncbi:expressed unknown protein [Seminavis robusta]|uniref:Uncharacterized protein n=1 Tax=Seminavis robusta TaxID=568900 RepID=A0A9N8EQW4_9STRA|nr:expressed unknown protein [Seminavis robusta]|eukprot:Sro1820_g299720.1 n/a (615) ;mRNA; r:11922-14065